MDSSELRARPCRICVVLVVYGRRGMDIWHVFEDFNWSPLGRRTVILGEFYVIILR